VKYLLDDRYTFVRRFHRSKQNENIYAFQRRHAMHYRDRDRHDDIVDLDFEVL